MLKECVSAHPQFSHGKTIAILRLVSQPWLGGKVLFVLLELLYFRVVVVYCSQHLGS